MPVEETACRTGPAHGQKVLGDQPSHESVTDEEHRPVGVSQRRQGVGRFLGSRPSEERDSQLVGRPANHASRKTAPHTTSGSGGNSHVQCGGSGSAKTGSVRIGRSGARACADCTDLRRVLLTITAAARAFSAVAEGIRSRATSDSLKAAIQPFVCAGVIQCHGGRCSCVAPCLASVISTDRGRCLTEWRSAARPERSEGLVGQQRLVGQRSPH